MSRDEKRRLSERGELAIEQVRDSRENIFRMIIGVFGISLFLGEAYLITIDPCLASTPVTIVVFALVYDAFAAVFFAEYLRSNSIRVGANQLPEVYQILRRVCTHLKMKVIPEMYIIHGDGLLQSIIMRVFLRRGIIVITSESVDALTRKGDSRQLLWLVGRQVGHLAAGHFDLWFIGIWLGRFTSVIYAAWWRRCHRTADRIGMLVCGDPEVARRALVNFTVGQPLGPLVNLADIQEQYSQVNSSFVAQIIKLFQVHPHLIERIEYLDQFSREVDEFPDTTPDNLRVAYFPLELQTLIVNGTAILGDRNRVSVSNVVEDPDGIDVSSDSALDDIHTNRHSTHDPDQ